MDKQYVIWNEEKETYEVVNAGENGFDPTSYKGDELVTIESNDAHIEPDGTKFYAFGTDRAGDRVEVKWDTLPSYDPKTEDDAGFACDWKYPVSVENF